MLTNKMERYSLDQVNLYLEIVKHPLILSNASFIDKVSFIRRNIPYQTSNQQSAFNFSTRCILQP